MKTASAPGKIILFGEHAVVYGRPALAVPVTQVRAVAQVMDAPAPGIWIDAPDIALHGELTALPPGHALRTVIESVFRTLGVSAPPPMRVRVTSSIPVASGLGSGAAVSVALIRALSAFLGQMLSDEQVNALAYEAEKLHHGTPSGIDNTVITFGRPVYFVRGQPIEPFRAARPFPLVIADTGIPAPTRESVGDVRRLWEAEPARWEAVFDAIGSIVRAARQAIERGEIPALGPLMDENHALLRELTVSSPELDRLAQAARTAGALGAKLSGGGRGGNLIALVPPERAEAVEAALRLAGAKRTILTTIQENP